MRMTGSAKSGQVACCRNPRVARIGWFPPFDCRALFLIEVNDP